MNKLSIAYTTLLLLITTFTSAFADNQASTLPATNASDTYFSPNPVLALFNYHNDAAWLSSDRYEFTKIDGLQETYKTGEPIVFYVEGQSEKLDVNIANGFYVLAAHFDKARRYGLYGTVTYDHDKRAWEVRITAPKDATKEYKLVLNLYCRKKDSPCATTYGFGTQVDRVYPLKVTDSNLN